MTHTATTATVLALALTLCTPAFATTTVSLTVPGSANPYLAGLPAGAIASSGDSAPNQSPVEVTGLSISGGNVFSFAAEGQVSLGTGLGPDPDGGSTINHTGTPENGFSDALMPRVSLLGVFLDDMLPTATAAPVALAFGTTAEQNYASLSPLLKQIFFIGDGMTDGGTVQEIVAPTGATRLFLGTMDGFGWFNNTGEFTVRATGPDATGAPVPPIPLPAGALLLFAGLSGLAILRART